MGPALKSITLDHCWVCLQRFTDVHPPGPMLRHEHHMVPRAYGGADGPTISLCDSHHNALHKVAICLINKKPYFTHTQGATDEQKSKLLYLANIVFNAELKARNDPNKLASAMVSLDQKHKLMIDRLQKVYPKARSREKLLLLALEVLHAKHFS